MLHSINKKMNKFLAIPNKKLSELASVRELRAFVYTCNHGSMAAAAQALSLTAPAISVLLRELEQKLGVRLFDRTTRNLRLSAGGREALVFAERILKDLGDLHAGMDDIASGRSGTLRIAATSSLAQTLLPRIIARYSDRHPLVRIELNDCAPNQFQDLILQGKADLGVGVLERNNPALHCQAICKDRLYVVATNAWVLPGKRQMSWQQLGNLPLITMRSGYGIRTPLEQAAAQAKVQLQVTHEVNLMGTALAMVEQSLGVAVLPESLLHFSNAQSLEMRILVDPTIHRQLSVITPQGQSSNAALLAFTELAREYLGSLREALLHKNSMSSL